MHIDAKQPPKSVKNRQRCKELYIKEEAENWRSNNSEAALKKLGQRILDYYYRNVIKNLLVRRICSATFEEKKKPPFSDTILVRLEGQILRI